MTDDRIDALIRRLDVPFDPDVSFARTTLAALKPRARAARVSDASRVGRLQRDLRLVLSGARWPVISPRTATVGFVALLILSAMAALAIVGAINRAQPIRNGPLIVSIEGQLKVVDAVGGAVRTVDLDGDRPRGVSRSPDGRLIAFWTSSYGRSHLNVIGVDGTARRELSPDLILGWTDTIDVWSSDSRTLATEARLDGTTTRIILVDVVTGSASPVTPLGVVAHNPLWSPDDRWIAFTEESSGVRSLAVIRVDGSDKRTISGDVVGVAGPDTWSPDGSWIYFDSDGGVYRSNVAGGFSELLIGKGRGLETAHAPASSPDGALMVFIVPRPDGLAYDLHVANSDGSGARRLLERATHAGWSADGRLVLAEWTPAGQPGGLAVIAPDGGEFRVVLPFGAACQHGPRCTDGVGWGQPRP